MLTPTDIHQRSEKKYTDVLQAYLRGETYTPIHYACGKPPEDIAQRRIAIETLTKHSVDSLGFGYHIEYETINTRDMGRQTIPKRIVFATLDQFLAFIRKQKEFELFVKDVALIRRRLPSLEVWLQSHPLDVIAQHSDWLALLDVCDYFIQKGRPNLFARELAISIHTKFIEQHETILRSLLDVILSAEHIMQVKEFAPRYGLRTKPTLVRLRLLDEQLEWQFGLRLDDLTLPVPQVAHLLEKIKPQHVIIVENELPFLTLPRLEQCVALWGKGFQVHVLRDMAWLAKTDILYWGDIDAHGFQILSDVRGIFAHTRSVMMDAAMLQAYQTYVGRGATLPKSTFPNLKPQEFILAQDVNTNQIRFEQEHIPHDMAIMMLKTRLTEKP